MAKLQRKLRDYHRIPVSGCLQPETWWRIWWERVASEVLNILLPNWDSSPQDYLLMIIFKICSLPFKSMYIMHPIRWNILGDLQWKCFWFDLMFFKWPERMQSSKQQDGIKQEGLKISIFGLKNSVIQIDNLECLLGSTSSKYDKLRVESKCFYLRWHLLKKQ